LFQPLFPEPEKLELTLARIAGIVGEGSVGSVELLDTHREGAFAMRHFGPASPESASIRPSANHKQQQARKRKTGLLMSENQIACQVIENSEINSINSANKMSAEEKMSAVIALRLFRPPISASVTLREAKPVRMRCLEREDIAGEIVWTAGPWRSSGDWSDHEGWSREEWDIAVSVGAGLILYRLVQNKLGGNWFVEGTYD
jgi:protein ImuB